MEQISVSGTSFLERILCTKKSSMPRCFFSPHNSLFSLVLIFPSFWVKSLRSQTLVIGGSVWNKKCKCWRNAHAFERSGQSFGFPQIVRARTKNLCYAPSLLAHSVRNVSELVPARHMSYDLCICAHQLRHNAIDLCQPRGALCTRNCARARFGKPKTMWSLRSNEFGGQVQLQLTFCSTHINPWKQGILLGLPWEN